MESLGPISKPLALLVEALANSATFQERAGVASAEALESRLYWPHLVADIWTVARPCAVLMSSGIGWDHIASGAGNHLRPHGSIDVLFADTDQYPEDSRESQVDFENFVGQTLADVAAVAGQDEQLSITRIDQVEPPALTDPVDASSIEPFWLAKYRVTWGRI